MPGQPTAKKFPAATSSTNTPTRSELPVAGLRRRLLAMVYDTILLFALLFCVAGVYFTLLLVFNSDADAAAGFGSAQTGDVLHELEVVEPGWIFYPLMLFVYVGFYVYFWRQSGQTLGMRAWKIRLLDCNDKRPGWTQLIIRLLAAGLSLGLLGLGYFTLLLNRDKGTWHDRLSGTRVVYDDGKQRQ